MHTKVIKLQRLYKPSGQVETIVQQAVVSRRDYTRTLQLIARFGGIPKRSPYVYWVEVAGEEAYVNSRAIVAPVKVPRAAPQP